MREGRRGQVWSAVCRLLKSTEAGMWPRTELTNTIGANCIKQGGGEARGGEGGLCCRECVGCPHPQRHVCQH
jgi:hypothetical protein